MGMCAYFTAIDPQDFADIQSDPGQLEEFLFPDDGDGEREGTIDIDKSWHGIHFILSKIAISGNTVLEQAILGGEPLGEDVGYGPARVLMPSEVKEITAALSGISIKQFESEFDPVAMEAEEIYPQIWNDDEDVVEYLTHFFPGLVAFYVEAANRGQGMVLHLA